HLAQMVLGRPRFAKCGLEDLHRLRQWRDVLTYRWQDVPRDVQCPAFLLDFVQRNNLSAVLDVLKGAIPGDDLLAVCGVQEVLRPALSKQGRCIDDQYFFLSG